MTTTGTSFWQQRDGTNLKLIANTDTNGTSTLSVTSDPSNPLATTSAPATVATFVDGKDTSTAAVTARQLTTNALTQGLIVQADPTNTVDVVVGNSGSQSMRLGPGKTASLPVSNANVVYWHPFTAVISILNYWGV